MRRGGILALKKPQGFSAVSPVSTHFPTYAHLHARTYTHTDGFPLLNNIFCFQKRTFLPSLSLPSIMILLLLLLFLLTRLQLLLQSLLVLLQRQLSLASFFIISSVISGLGIEGESGAGGEKRHSGSSLFSLDSISQGKACF